MLDRGYWIDPESRNQYPGSLTEFKKDASNLSTE
jgi:hypothetical protein